MYKLTPILSALIVLWQSANVAATCAKPSTIAKFDYLRFNGTWYSIRNIPSIFEQGLICQETTNYADTKAQGSFSVVDQGIKESDRSIVTSNSTLSTPDESHPGVLVDAGAGGLMTMPFYILDTDYDTFAYTYACSDDLFSLENGWILSRKRTLDPEVVQRGLALFAKAKVDVTKFEVTKQTDCKTLNNRNLKFRP